MNQRHFGCKSEASLSEIEEVSISSYRHFRAKGKREADLDGLPARIIGHRLSDEELSNKVDAYFTWIKQKYTQVTQNSKGEWTEYF